MGAFVRVCVFSEPRSFAVRCGGLCSPFPRLALSVDRPGRRSCGILGGSCCPKVAGVASLVAEMHDAPMAAASADARAETRAFLSVSSSTRDDGCLDRCCLRCVWLTGRRGAVADEPRHGGARAGRGHPGRWLGESTLTSLVLARSAVWWD